MTIEEIIRGIAEKWKEAPADEEVYCQHVDTYRAFSECANELIAALPDILAAQKAETAAMMEKAAAPLYKALMAICEFHGGCYCGECKLDGSQDFLCIETREAIEEYRALIPASAAAALAEENRKARIAMAEEMHILMRGATCGPHCLGCQRLAALRAEGAKPSENKDEGGKA